MKNSLRLPGKDIYNFIESSNLKDISVLEASFRKKHPDVSKKPMSKNYFALHLILKGAGKLITHSGEYELKKNDIFVRFPNETITYYDYPDNPFNYIFVTFNGTAVMSYCKRIGISDKNRVFASDDEITLLFKHLVLISRDYPEINDLISAGYMHLIFANLAKQSSGKPTNKYDVKESYVASALNIIQSNLQNADLSANYISQFLNLNTDYFLRIFKNAMGIAFSKYVVAKRMNLAVNMINDGETSVSKIAAACGYENASYFTKTFKLYYNQRPKDYIDKTLNHIKNLR